MPITVWPGRPDPLGATWDGHGTNFAVFSEHAVRVELCLFDDVYGKEAARIALPEQTRNVWHAYLNDVGPKASVSTPTSSCWTRMRAPSLVALTGGRPFSAIVSALVRRT